MSEYKVAVIVKTFLSRFVKWHVFYGILMNTLVCGNYVNYYAWSSYIHTQQTVWNCGHEEMRGDFPQHACLRLTWVQNSVLYEYSLLKKKNKKKNISTTAQKCLVKFKMFHPKWCYKIYNLTFSYRLIVAAIFDEKSNILFCVNPFLYTL